MTGKTMVLLAKVLAALLFLCGLAYIIYVMISSQPYTGFEWLVLFYLWLYASCWLVSGFFNPGDNE
jgi:ABC-type polysaccharide/polyol phosphate export permease